MDYTIADVKVIMEALKETNPWLSNKVCDIKKEIKKYNLERTYEECAYCRRNMKGEAMLDIDQEHILPKWYYDNCIFDLPNLTVSCKRCNMVIKGRRLNFLEFCPRGKYGKNKNLYFNSSVYKMVHPNADYYYDHISLNERRSNYNKFVKYEWHTKKGKFTYEFFKLYEKESDELTKAQGAERAVPRTDLAQKVADRSRDIG